MNIFSSIIVVYPWVFLIFNLFIHLFVYKRQIIIIIFSSTIDRNFLSHFNLPLCCQFDYPYYLLSTTLEELPVIKSLLLVYDILLDLFTTLGFQCKSLLKCTRFWTFLFTFLIRLFGVPQETRVCFRIWYS